jgi:hypothetical protein
VKRLNGKFATDTLWATVRSLRQNNCAQIYSHKCGFQAAYVMPAATGETVGHSLLDFIHEFGAPEHLTCDGASVQVGSKTLFMQTIRRTRIDTHISEPRRPNESPTEAAIREIKKRWYRIMEKMRVPKRLWDYGLIWVCETGNFVVSSSRYANGRSPLEIITGETPDITEYLDFTFYDWCMHRTNAGLGESSIGRWLGVSHKVGQLMSYWILPISGIPISCTTVQRITELEKTTDDVKERMQEFNKGIQEKMEAPSARIEKAHWEHHSSQVIDLEGEDPEFIEEFRRVISDESIPEADENEANKSQEPSADMFDPYLTMEIGLPRGEDNDLQHAHVKRRAVDVDGKPVAGFEGI